MELPLPTSSKVYTAGREAKAPAEAPAAESTIGWNPDGNGKLRMFLPSNDDVVPRKRIPQVSDRIANLEHSWHNSRIMDICQLSLEKQK